MVSVVLGVLFYMVEKNADELTRNYLDDVFYTDYTAKKIRIRLLTTFPYGSIEIQNLEVKEALPGSRRNVALFNSIKLQFNLWDIFSENYIIHRIVVNGANLHLRIDSNGVSNFAVLKKKYERKEQSHIRLDLKKLIIKNSALEFWDVRKNMLAKTRIENTELVGLFSRENFDVKTEILLNPLTVSVAGVKYINHRRVLLKGNLGVESNKGLITLKKGTELKLQKADFFAEGRLQYTEEGILNGLKISSQHADIKTLLSLIPSKYTGRFDKYKTTGSISFVTRIEGLFGRNYTPLIYSDFTIQNGSAIEEGKTKELKKIWLKGSFTNGNLRTRETSVLKLDTFSCSLEGKKLSGSIYIEDFIQPYFYFTFKGDADLATLNAFLHFKNVSSMQGSLSADLRMNGNLHDLKKMKTIRRTYAEGFVVLKNISIHPLKHRFIYSHVNGKIIFHDNGIEAQNFFMNVGSSDFRVNGYCRNVMEFLLHPEKKLETDISVVSNKINLTELAEGAHRKKDSTYHITFPDFIRYADVKVKCGEFMFNRFHCSNITGRVVANEKKIVLSSFSMNAMKGSMYAEGEIVKTGAHAITTNVSSNLKRIDISELFYQMGNFNQTYVTEYNLRGIVDASVENLFIPWDENLKVDYPRITAKINLAIDSGELIEFKPVMRLAKHFDLRRFQHLQFSRLQNTLTIKDNIITIPEMEIKSNVMNLNAYGTHSLKNDVDYHIKLNLSQVVLGKKDDDLNFPNVKVDDSGGLLLFIRMYGHANKPFIDYDAGGLKDRVVKDLKFHFKTLKSFLQDLNNHNGTK